LPEILYQVRLVVVSGIVGQVGELHIGMILQDEKRPLKADDAVKLFRRSAYVVGEYAVELFLAQAGTIGQVGDAYLVVVVDGTYGRKYAPQVVCVEVFEPFEEEVFYHLDAA